MYPKVTVTKASLPDFEDYIKMLKPLWESRQITNMGKYHQMLEEQLEDFFQVPYVSLMVNGHLSLELAIQAMGFPEGGEVITTPFTFISTTHAIVRNHLKPVFCDIKLSDYTIDESKIEDLITEKTVAILPVHVYGNICNVEAIESLARKYQLKVIYDAAHAFGESMAGRSAAGFGDASVFSFHATKVFTTVEGGAVTFSNREMYDKLYNLKNFGIRSEELVTEVGANAKMNEFCAAMGLCNLRTIHEKISSRRQRAEYYLEQLEPLSGIKLPEYDTKHIKYSYGYFPVLFQKDEHGISLREKVYSELKLKGILARKYFYPITSDEVCFKNKYKNVSLNNARYAAANILVLPLYPDLELNDISTICQTVRECLK